MATFNLKPRQALTAAPEFAGAGALAMAMPAASPVSGAVALPLSPVETLLRNLKEKGVALPESLATPRDAAQLNAAAQAMPEGELRNTLVSLGQAVTASKGAAPSDAALGGVYDNSTAAAAPVESAWTKLPVLGGLVKRIAERNQRPAPVPPPVDPKTLEVPLEMLRWTPAPESLPESTRDVVPAREKQIVGQDRALQSVIRGLRLTGNENNLYVSGPEGSGRETAVRHILDQLAPTMPTPSDIAAVTNFRDEKAPIILELAPGGANKLQAALEKFIQSYQKALPQMISSKQVSAFKRQIEGDFNAAVRARRAAFEAEVAKVRLPGGKFGIQIITREGDAGVDISVGVTYADPSNDGEPTLLGADEHDALIKGGAYSREEWLKAVDDSEAAARPFQDKLMAILEQDEQESIAADEKIAQIHMQIAQTVVENLAPTLIGAVVPNRHDTPEHKEFEKRAEVLQKAWRAEVAEVRIGQFGIDIIVAEQGVGVTILKPEGGKMIPMSQEETQQKLESGEIDQAEIQRKVKPLLARLKTISQTINEEHKAVHANDPEPTEQETKAVEYVQMLLSHAAAFFPAFMPHNEADDSVKAQVMRMRLNPEEMYRVSVLVDNSKVNGAPVIWERSPSYERLFGSADDSGRVMLSASGPVKAPSPGGPRLKAGSFLKANGGFLILNVLDVLREPGVWPALMQAVRNGQAEISEGGIMGLVSHQGEKYQIEAGKVKVVLIGSPMLKYLLRQHDDDFARHFTAAEFEPSLNIDETSIDGYLQFMKQVIAASAGEIFDLSRSGIAALLEFSARMAGANTKLSAQFGMLDSIMREATFWAKEMGAAEIGREHIDAVLAARSEPEEVYVRHVMESYHEGVQKAETSGAIVGQANGLAVTGHYGVPKPIRVVVRPGPFQVLSADSEAQLTGKMFRKSAADVRGFLIKTFGDDLTSGEFEISFGQSFGLDGDSATSTMIYASLSALSGVPIQQRFAMTGSAHPFGEVQAIGGENEKTEGFYIVSRESPRTSPDIVNAVIIPADNESGLMLRSDIVESVRRTREAAESGAPQGGFNVYGVRDIREGMELLTGVPWQTIIDKARERLKELKKAAK